MHFFKTGRFTLIGITLVAVAAAHGVHADTVLIFEDDNGIWLSESDMPTYGDRVTSNTQDGFLYGGAADTPNVVADFTDGTEGWPSSYGDLSDVIFSPSGTVLEMTLTADPGFRVLLHAFDLAGWLRTDYVINSVEVLGGQGQSLFFQANVLVQGDANGPQHTSFNFAPLSSGAITIRVDATNVTTGFGSENVGLDNVRFSQVPEPATATLALCGLLGVVSLSAASHLRRRPSTRKGAITDFRRLFLKTLD